MNKHSADYTETALNRLQKASASRLRRLSHRLRCDESPSRARTRHVIQSDEQVKNQISTAHFKCIYSNRKRMWTIICSTTSMLVRTEQPASAPTHESNPTNWCGGSGTTMNLPPPPSRGRHFVEALTRAVKTCVSVKMKPSRICLYEVYGRLQFCSSRIFQSNIENISHQTIRQQPSK